MFTNMNEMTSLMQRIDHNMSLPQDDNKKMYISDGALKEIENKRPKNGKKVQ